MGEKPHIPHDLRELLSCERPVAYLAGSANLMWADSLGFWREAGLRFSNVLPFEYEPYDWDLLITDPDVFRMWGGDHPYKELEARRVIGALDITFGTITKEGIVVGPIVKKNIAGREVLFYSFFPNSEEEGAVLRLGKLWAINPLLVLYVRLWTEHAKPANRRIRAVIGDRTALKFVRRHFASAGLAVSFTVKERGDDDSGVVYVPGLLEAFHMSKWLRLITGSMRRLDYLLHSYG